MRINCTVPDHSSNRPIDSWEPVARAYQSFRQRHIGPYLPMLGWLLFSDNLSDKSKKKP